MSPRSAMSLRSAQPLPANQPRTLDRLDVRQIAQRLQAEDREEMSRRHIEVGRAGRGASVTERGLSRVGGLATAAPMTRSRATASSGRTNRGIILHLSQPPYRTRAAASRRASSLDIRSRPGSALCQKPPRHDSLRPLSSSDEVGVVEERHHGIFASTASPQLALEQRSARWTKTSAPAKARVVNPCSAEDIAARKRRRSL